MQHHICHVTSLYSRYFKQLIRRIQKINLINLFVAKNSYAETTVNTKAIILEEESRVNCAPPQVSIVDGKSSITDTARHGMGDNLVIAGKLVLNCAETKRNNQSWKLEKVRTHDYATNYFLPLNSRGRNLSHSIKRQLTDQ